MDLKKHIHIFIIFTIMLLYLFSVSFAQNLKVSSLNPQKELSFLGEFLQNTTILTSYLISPNKIITGKILFKMETFYDNSSIFNCSKEISFKKNSYPIEILCPVPIKGNGNYLFKSEIIKNFKIIKNSSNVFLLYNKYITQTFISKKNKTIILININKKINTSFIITSFIPKSVISNLNYKNAKLLINSSKKFVIVKSDPLIAWNLERAPAKINYTIYKNINKNQQQKFSVNFKNTKQAETISYFFFGLVLLLVIIILFMIFRPILKK